MTRRLGFGYLFDFRNPPQWKRPFADLYAETIDLVVETETLGFASAWVPEHHGAEDAYMPSPLVALAAMASRTSRIRLGSGIAIAPLYDAVRFAEDAAVLDILSNGRLDLGLAIGYRRREYAAAGLDFGKRGARFDELLHIVRALWAGETVSFEGKHFAIHDARIAPAPERQIPLFIGGFAEKALERVAKFADGYFGNEDVCGLYADKLREQGKDPASARILIQGLFHTVAEDPQAAMEELAPYFHHVNNSYGAWLNDKAIGIDDPALKPMSLEDFKKSGILRIDTPDQAIARFKAMQDRIAVEHYMLMRPPGLPAERFLHYAGLFAREVMPVFAG